MKAAVNGLALLVGGVWVAGTHPYPPLGWAIAALSALMLAVVVVNGVRAVLG